MKRFLFLSGLHLALFLGLLSAGMDFSGVDGEDPAFLSQVASRVAGLLGQPGIAVHRALGPEGPDALEWALVIANSLLWGALLSLIVARVGHRSE